ncbi:MAG: monoamine oxidase [Frankiales bacterium]|jgi:monoamine oxidase|nr:monoamine oxidase [Frankiales bacterium]
MAEGHGLSRRQVLGGAAAAGVAVTAGVGPTAARRATAAPPVDVDVVVVGAGLAGLTTARELVRAGKSVRVLEARNRVGGRTFNHVFPNGRVSDLGGTWVGPTQDHIRALANEMGVHEFPQPDHGNAVYYSRGIRTTWDDSGPTGTTPPDPELIADALVVVKLLDQMAKQTPVDKPWTAKRAREWDGVTLGSWLQEHTANNHTLKIAGSAIEAIVGAEAREISLLFTVAYIARATNGTVPGTFERLINTRGGAQAARFVEGAHTISVRMAQALGNRVVLNAPVRRINQDTNGATVISDVLTAQCKQVVVAVPPTLSNRIIYSPVMPAERDQIAQRLPQGWLIKVGVYYDKPWWRDRGLNGFAVSDIGPARTTFDISPKDSAFGGLLGFVGGDEARGWGDDHRRLRDGVLTNFSTYFGRKAKDPTSVVIQDWADEEWSRGGPTAIAGPGVVYGYNTAISKPVGRIHWAGTETATYWQGYMDGAVRSGERAAQEVLAEL